MIEFEEPAGLLHHRGRLFVCPCGNSEMKVEIDSSPTNFWCACGAIYTEQLVDAMGEERLEVASGE